MTLGTLSGFGQTVCVTGAGGFIASWLVKLLLEKGYTVRGTMIQKNGHLMELEGARERLSLHKADLLDFVGLKEAVMGCDGLFHVACPITNDPEEILEAAVNGTKNIMNAAAEAKVGRVVFTSSVGAVYMDPNRTPDVLVDESCWSDLEFCRATKNWYCYAKVLAERSAWEVAKERGLDLVVVIPAYVLGPLLQPTINLSTLHILQYLTGAVETYSNATQGYVHVYDVAVAHVLVYETPSASGRYLCVESVLHRRELLEILAELFPWYPLPTKCSNEVSPWRTPHEFSIRKLKDLEMKFTPMKQCLYDTVKNLQEKGLPIPNQENQPKHDDIMSKL